MTQITNADYWIELLKKTPRSYKEWFKGEEKYLQSRITKNAHVLDIGCGDGRSIFDIISITENVIGIDHDQKAIDQALKNFKDYPAVIFKRDDATNLSFPNETFDFVICMGTFVNFADKKYVALEEMKRVLKKSGRIIISVFSEDALDERITVYKTLGIKIKEIKGGKVTFDESVGDNISEQFSRQELKNIFSRTLLKIEDIQKVSIGYLITLSK